MEETNLKLAKLIINDDLYEYRINNKLVSLLNLNLPKNIIKFDLLDKFKENIPTNKFNMYIKQIISSDSINIFNYLLPNLDINKEICGNYMLFYAIQCKSAKILEELLKIPELNVNVVNYDMCALYYACIWGSKVNILKMLCSRKDLNINILDKYERNVLFRSSSEVEILDFLINHTDLDINQIAYFSVFKSTEKQMTTPLHIAIQSHDFIKIFKLLEHPKIDLTIRDYTKKTALEKIEIELGDVGDEFHSKINSILRKKKISLIL